MVTARKANPPMVHLPVGEMPAVIRESARHVLSAHGFRLVDAKGNEVTQEITERLLSELGRNASQSLFSIDTNPENL